MGDRLGRLISASCDDDRVDPAWADSDRPGDLGGFGIVIHGSEYACLEFSAADVECLLCITPGQSEV